MVRILSEAFRFYGRREGCLLLQLILRAPLLRFRARHFCSFPSLSLSLLACGVRSSVDERSRVVPLLLIFDHLWARAQTVHVAQIVQKGCLIIELEAA